MRRPRPEPNDHDSQGDQNDEAGQQPGGSRGRTRMNHARAFHGGRSVGFDATAWRFRDAPPPHCIGIAGRDQGSARGVAAGSAPSAGDPGPPKTRLMTPHSSSSPPGVARITSSFRGARAPTGRSNSGRSGEIGPSGSPLSTTDSIPEHAPQPQDDRLVLDPRRAVEASGQPQSAGGQRARPGGQCQSRQHRADAVGRIAHPPAAETNLMMVQLPALRERHRCRARVS